MAEGRGVEVLTTEQGWRVQMGSLEENQCRRIVNRFGFLRWIEMDLNVSKNNCFGDSGAVHALLGAIYIYVVFFLQRFFQLSQCSTHALWFFLFYLKMCHYVPFYRRISGWKRYYSASMWADLIWSRKEIEGKEFRLQKFVNTNSPSLVCSLETNLFEGWTKLGMMIMCDIFSAFFVSKENIWRNLIFLFVFNGACSQAV